MDNKEPVRDGTERSREDSEALQRNHAVGVLDRSLFG